MVASAAVQKYASHLNLDEWTANIAMLNCFLTVNAYVATTALIAIYSLLYQKHVLTQVLK